MAPLPAQVRRITSKLAGQRFGRNVLRDHEHRPPSAATIVELFDREWVSQLPPDVGVPAGSSPTFDDPRMHWALPKLGVEGASVLELGPLEGGHTYMLERAGAERIVAIESNRRAFLRCLATRELVGLERTRFLCGDFLGYLRETDETFDVCVASAVLYHLLDPVELIELLARRVRRLYLWTVYYDEDILKGSSRFRAPQRATTAGFEHTLHPRPYSRIGVRLASYPGGANRTASWLSRDDLLAALEHFGWGEIEVGLERSDADPGPSLGVTARRAA